MANADLDDDLTALILRAEIIPSLLSPNFAPTLRSRHSLRAGGRGAGMATSRPLTVASLAAAWCHAAAVDVGHVRRGSAPGARDERRGRGGAGEVLRAHSKRIGEVTASGGGGSEGGVTQLPARVRGKCADGLKALLADLR